MKARAWIVMLLIGMISYTGFCNTADLIQNSDSEIVASYDVAVFSDCVNVVNELHLVKEYRVYKGTKYFDIKVYKDNMCDYVVCSNLKAAPDNRVAPISYNYKTHYNSTIAIKDTKESQMHLNYLGIIPQANLIRLPYDPNCQETNINSIYRKSRDALSCSPAIS